MNNMYSKPNLVDAALLPQYCSRCRKTVVAKVTVKKIKKPYPTQRIQFYSKHYFCSECGKRLSVSLWEMNTFPFGEDQVTEFANEREVLESP